MLQEADPAADLPAGPKDPKSTVLSIEEEAAILAFRRHTQLPPGGSSLGAIEMGIADRVGLELPLRRGLPFNLGQPRDSMALQAAMQ